MFGKGFWRASAAVWLLLGWAVSAAGCATETSVPEWLPESDYQMVAGIVDFAKIYRSTSEMYQDAEIVAKVKVRDSQVKSMDESQPPMMYTFSTVDVETVYKGDPNLHTLLISERGGPYKATKPKVITQEQTTDGSPAMKQGHEYIVFLHPGTNMKKWGYTIVGVVQGKIRIENGYGVATAEKSWLKKEPEVFDFQNKFSGKPVEEIEKALHE